MLIAETFNFDLTSNHVTAIRHSLEYYLACFKTPPTEIGQKSLSRQVFLSLLERTEKAEKFKPLLHWQPIPDCVNAAVAYLGYYPAGDGVMFTLEMYPTCYRRGSFKLVIDIAQGPMHEAWGCFDGQDQPMRYYHKQSNAIDEAECIARVLMDGRIKHGPIKRPAT